VYIDLATGEAMGLVDVTYLIDSSCSDCYDVAKQKQIIENNFGVTIKSEQTVDARSTSGRALIDKYSIAQAPTVIISSEVSAYEALTQAWRQVGSIEDDGTYVFRQNAALGGVIYKNLDTGEIIRPEVPNK